MTKVQCVNCGATLVFHEIKNGVVEIMCKTRNSRCHRTINRIHCKYGRCTVIEKGKTVDKTVTHL